MSKFIIIGATILTNYSFDINLIICILNTMTKTTFITSIDEFENWLNANLNGEYVDFYLKNDTLFINTFELSDDSLDLIESSINNSELFYRKMY